LKNVTYSYDAWQLTINLDAITTDCYYGNQTDSEWSSNNSE